MKISTVERAVLEITEFRADAPIEEVAKATKLRPHVVRYALNRMLERGIIKRRAYIDSYLLGTKPFIVFAKIPAHRETSRRAFLTFLKRHPSISFVAEVAGRYNCWFEVRAEDIFDIEDILLCVAERFGDVLQQKEILAMPSHMDFSLVTRNNNRPKQFTVIETRRTRRTIKLDPTDLSILRAIAKEWMTSHKTLATALNIPASTLTYRIERMKRERLILAARHWIDIEQLGEHRFLHLVSVRVLSEKLKREFTQFAGEHGTVFILRIFIGRWDFLFETHHERAMDVAKFTEALHAKFPGHIAEHETLSVLNFTKTSDCTTLDEIRS